MLIDVYVVMLHGQFFVFHTSSVCSHLSTFGGQDEASLPTGRDENRGQDDEDLLEDNGALSLSLFLPITWLRSSSTS